MNAFAKQALATVVLSAAFVAAPASAITTGSLQLDVQSAISGDVNVSVRDGVATLTGNADQISKAAAGRAALANPEVDSVVNLIDAG